MNLNLLKCAFGVHEYKNPIKDDTLNSIVRICAQCNKVISVIEKDRHKEYELDKREIINYIEFDELHHAKQKLNILLKKLGY